MSLKAEFYRIKHLFHRVNKVLLINNNNFNKIILIFQTNKMAILESKVLTELKSLFTLLHQMTNMRLNFVIIKLISLLR